MPKSVVRRAKNERDARSVFCENKDGWKTVGFYDVFVCSEKGFQKVMMQGQDFIDQDFRRADIIYYKYS